MTVTGPTASAARTPLDPMVPAIDPERAARYRAAGVWTDELVGARIAERFRTAPDRCAVVDGERRTTYGELGHAVRAAAGRLRGLGIGPGDRVGVQLSNSTEYVVLVLALLEIGAPPVLILPAFRAHELDHIVSVTRPVALAVERGTRRSDALATARDLAARHPDLRHLLVRGAGDAADGTLVDLTELCRPEPGASGPVPPPAEAPGAAPHDAAVFLLSSGTTGLPKAIARTHEGYGYMIRTATVLAGVTERTVNLVVMPAEHGFVMNCPGLLGTLSAGGTAVLTTPASARHALELIERERVTHSTLVPTLALQWIAAARERTYDLSSLEVIQVGGARPSADLAAGLREVLGATVQQCYGMSEGLLCYTRLDDPVATADGTQGAPASPLDEMRVVDADGAEVAAGEMGELLTRGPYTVAGYYRNADATASSFTADGFYRTGDLVRLDARGNVLVEGRVRDVINRGGEKISAEELEQIARQHPGIADVAGVAMPHPLYGEAVCLYAVPAAGAAEAGEELDLRAVRRFLEDRGLARYKFPERLETVSALPLTGIGKIDKAALRKDIAARTAAGT
ncbi:MULTISPECIES: (2,3-dihydroxybenzoyl)adenylate synthase [Streptomyces]|uniref:(2,3-dihydroxybenzoyl)adenylate synthase n=1 Tax=Streptomyces TaxID=1883 RepID=UPI0004CD6DC6|nr:MULTISPECIES: AMP-binding protein [Streptomyces]KOT62970.1 2,3-dihydroxybenzoate--AMP ligase [Streptomyces rimosus subsp. rimosus]